MEKGEIARNEQALISMYMQYKSFENTMEKGEIARNEQALVYMYMQYKSFEKTMGKGETARNEQFILFPQCSLSAIFIKFEIIVCILSQF